MNARPFLIALIVGAALALPVALLSAARLEVLVAASGLPGLIPAIRPLLEGSMRTLLVVALGIAPLLVVLLVVAIARQRESAAEARAIADFEAAGARRRLFRPAPFPAKRPPTTAGAPSSFADVEPSPEPEPAPLDLTGAVLAAPEELGSPPPEPMPAPPPPPLVEPESLRKPRPRPTATPASVPSPPLSPPPSETDDRTRLDQLEAMLGALPPLPDHGQAAPPQSNRKTRTKDSATARDVKKGIVRSSDDNAADKQAVFARLEQALAELRRLEH